MSLHPRFWRCREEALLRAYYPLGGVRIVNAALLAAGFAERSADAIYRRACDLGVCYTPQKSAPEIALRQRQAWTIPEEEILREFYPRGGTRAAAWHLPGRSKEAIRSKANQIGLAVISLTVGAAR